MRARDGGDLLRSHIEDISFIEVTSGAALLWRMSADAEVDRRDRASSFLLARWGSLLKEKSRLGYKKGPTG